MGKPDNVMVGGKNLSTQIYALKTRSGRADSDSSDALPCDSAILAVAYSAGNLLVIALSRQT
jgi:hypothetical protein